LGTDKTTAALADLRGTAPRRSPTVRVLANYSGHTDCNVATLAFAAGVDMDKLLLKTQFAVPFGQSPFAFARGLQFENSIRADGYSKALGLLHERMGFEVKNARVKNLRVGFPKNRAGLQMRAEETRRLIGRILEHRPDAPNLIDGAVLTSDVAGQTAYYEADAMAARFNGPIHAGEVKSFPVVDGRPDPDKFGAALDQVAIYILLTQQLVDDLGGDPEAQVSKTAMLIAPKNVGLTPTLEKQDVTARVKRAGTLLGRDIPINDLAAGLPSGVFGKIADQSIEPKGRLEVLDTLVERVGNTFHPACFSTCGAARFCRAALIAKGDPVIAGDQAVRLMPGVPSLPRAVELARGAAPSQGEAAAAGQLERANRLYERALTTSEPVGAGR
jgi:hypothetical protein